jgi:hypothetical protein
MKGDFTRFTHDPRKHYTRVLRQQGRVDLDADWNEAVELFTRRDRIEATDVIGRCGVPEGSNGFKVEVLPDGSDLTVSPGRLYVEGILCEREALGPITDQDDLPAYPLPTEDGVYLAYADVWERHITYLEDPAIREVALGGPDTTTRTQTVCQVKLLRIADDGPLAAYDCESVPASPSTGQLAAGVVTGGAPTNPCAVPEGAGYTGLENRLYRVEIHDDGRDANGNVVRPPTFKWSRDNGAVVLPLASENGIDGDTLALKRLGFDEVLTLRVGDWVEVLGDETELYGRPGTLAQVVPNGIDAADLEIELDRDVSAHASEGHLKVRRWDHQPTDDLALIDGALPVPAGAFELEDGVVVEFEPGGTYHVGDYWLIPARTRTGDIEWPNTGTPPAAVSLPPRGIQHHYCTLALVRRSGGTWVDGRDCRPLFTPLTAVGTGGCCVHVEPGDDVQQAVDTVMAAGGGCIALCAGVHRIQGPLWLRGAVDVCIEGEGSATVVRCDGTDDAGFGGIVIESAQRVTLTDFSLVADDVRGLVTIRHDEAMTISRSITLRRLRVLNLAASDQETNLAAGVRLGHTEDVTFDTCHIAAETGIVSLWGNALPDLNAALANADDDGGDEQENHDAPAVITVDFEDLELGATFQPGGTVSTSSVTATVEPFERPDGDLDETGFARVEDGGEAGGSGYEIALLNANLAFDLPAAYEAVRINYSDLGGSINLRINGELHKPQDLADLDGTMVGGVRVAVAFSEEPDGVGQLRLEAGQQPIRTLAIGGVELWIDNVVLRGPSDRPAPALLPYGDGVTRLRMRDTRVRFGERGMLVARAEGWQIDGSDVRPFAEDRWARLRAAFKDVEADEAAARGPYRQLLARLETVFGRPGGHEGYAIQAFRWHNCTVRRSQFAGRHGLHAWWWLGGAASANAINARESGAHAFWLHRADWSANTTTTAEGVSLSTAGGHRVRMVDNRLRGPVGIANVALGAGIDGLDRLARMLLRGYGADRATDEAALYGVLVDESLRIMGCGPLLDALQPLADAVSPAPGIPAVYYFAEGVMSSLRAQTESDVVRGLPLIDLDVSRNDIACTQQGVGLDGFLPLGRLRVAGNRIHTTSGQALRIETNPFTANAHLIVFIMRGVLALLVERAQALRESADGEMAAVMAALSTLMVRWQSGAEALVDLDFRVEGNTIRSLQTAIESNLYELAVRANHITMQERRVQQGRGGNTGRSFGRVTTPEGASVVRARVRIVGTERVGYTDAKGAYTLSGLPPGDYELRASQTGYSTATQTLTVEAGEEVQVNFTISLLRSNRIVAGEGFSDGVVAAGSVAATASNAEMTGVIDVLGQSAALEPLAIALRDGAHTPAEAYATYLAAEPGPLATSEARIQTAETITLIQGQVSDPEMQQVTAQLNTALRANDRTQWAPLFVRLIRALQSYIDTQGILLKGVGGRIVENQVAVPADVNPDTESLGGVQVSVNASHLTVLMAVGNALMQYLGSDKDQYTLSDPLLGITDTLIDNNEIVGGVGHGISVQGVAGQPDIVQDLRVRGNQVRGLAGAGLFINEHALAVGLDVTGNHISACGRSTGLTQHKGGAVLRTVAACSLDGNQVLRCGEDLQGDHHAYGIDLDGLYGLRAADNTIQANGADEGTADDGGMRLVEVYGSALLHDNTIAFNHGVGLSWVNSARAGEEALLPPFLMNAVNAYLRMSRTVDDLVAEEQASIQGNALKSVADTDFPVFQLLNLREVLFTGNTCHAETTSAPLGEIQETSRGVVTTNQSQTNAEVAIAIKKMSTGVVLGNVGNRPIQLQASAGVEHAHNVPPAT